MSVQQPTARAQVNGAGRSSSASPQTAASYHHQNRISNTVYDITAEDKSSPTEVVGSYSAQYYTTVDSPSAESSPRVYNTASMDPETPLSSSKGSTSSEGTELSTAMHQNLGMPAANSPQSDMTAMHQNLCVPAANSPQSDMNVKHWTYEEQFKQLYNLSPESERKEFLDKLFDYMQKKGTPITRIPIMAKQPLDLYRLFKLVVERGGLVEVIKKKAWRNVAKELNLPASITSAAFTMRSQYVKYLYPYECEVAKLSDPQELQMAIDSNKRDRRHSETVEFISPQMTVGRSEMDITPVTHAVTATQGLQLISSPTVAIPHGSIPTYSGGFIVTPGGAHMMAASPQLVQMAHAPGIPIVMPTPVTPVKSEPTSDGDDSSSELSEPPTKKFAVDSHQVKVSLANSRLPFIPSNSGSFMIAPGGTQMVQAPNMASTTPQIVQMTAHPHIPGLMIPTTTSHSGLIREARFELESGETLTTAGRRVLSTQSSSSENGSGVPVAAIPPQSAGNIVMATRGTTALATAPHMTATASQGLIQMAPHSVLQLASQGRPERRREPEEEQVEESRKRDNMHTISTKMPFANISIQSAGGKEGGEGSNNASLLVTLELNNTVFQGVLFAKPLSSSPTR